MNLTCLQTVDLVDKFFFLPRQLGVSLLRSQVNLFRGDVLRHGFYLNHSAFLVRFDNLLHLAEEPDGRCAGDTIILPDLREQRVEREFYNRRLLCETLDNSRPITNEKFAYLFRIIVRRYSCVTQSETRLT